MRVPMLQTVTVRPRQIPGRRSGAKLRARPCDAPATLAQVLATAGTGEPEMRPDAVGAALQRGQILGIEQVPDPIVAAADAPARGGAQSEQVGAGGENIKRAIGPVAVDAIDLIERRHDHVAPLPEDGAVGGDEVLAAGERGHCRRLAHPAGPPRALPFPLYPPPP